MTNPINGNKPPMDHALGDSQRGRRSAEAGGQSAGVSAAKGGVQADSSGQTGQASEASQSDRLRAVLDGIKQAPDVDMGRVEALRESIAEGNYPIDADRIASRFMELEQMLER